MGLAWTNKELIYMVLHAVLQDLRSIYMGLVVYLHVIYIGLTWDLLRIYTGLKGFTCGLFGTEITTCDLLGT